MARVYSKIFEHRCKKKGTIFNVKIAVYPVLNHIIDYFGREYISADEITKEMPNAFDLHLRKPRKLMRLSFYILLH